MVILGPVVLICLLIIGLGVLYLFFRLITAWDRRRATERIVIGQINTVIRQNLSLPTALAIAAESESGVARVCLRHISKLLGQGLQLSEALRLGYPNCSAFLVSLISAGEKAGQLPLALSQVEQYLTDRDRIKTRVGTIVWPYAIIVLTAATVVTAALMVTVIPKYKYIFKDFDAELPTLLNTIVNFADEFAALLWIVFGLILAALCLGIYWSLRPRRLGNLTFVSRFGDSLRWYCPGMHSLVFGGGMSAMLQTMRFGVRSGIGLEGSARLAADIDVNCHLRPRMLRFAELLSRGVNVRVASDKAGLGDLTGVALSNGRRSNDMDSALRYASDYYYAIVSRGWMLLRNMVWPVWVLILATIVGTIVYAMFEPLVALLDATMAYY